MTLKDLVDGALIRIGADEQFNNPETGLFNYEEIVGAFADQVAACFNLDEAELRGVARLFFFRRG